MSKATKNTAYQLTALTTLGISATKTYREKGKKIEVEGYGRAKTFTAEVFDVDGKGRWLQQRRKKKHSFVVLGAPIGWKPGEKKRRLSADRDDDEATLRDVPRALMPIDVDQVDFDLSQICGIDDGERIAVALLDRLGLKGTACAWHLTSGHGFFGRYRARLWVELEEPATAEQMREYARERWGDEKVEVDGKQKNLVDFSVYQPQQPIYVADPILLDGIADPVARRCGFIDGDPLALITQRRNKDRKEKPEDQNVALLDTAGLYIRRYKPGSHCIVCPWEEMHSGPERDDDTFYHEPHYNGHGHPTFKCHHDSCAQRRWDDVLRHMGVRRGDAKSKGSPFSKVDANGDPVGATLVTVRASDVKIEPVEWLWQDRIAQGKATVIAGHPGGGKSQVTCDIAARVTTGAKWPVEGGRARAGSVLMLSSEDSVADTIVPRLMAAGADLSRVHIVESVEDESAQGRSFDLIADVAILDTELERRKGVALVIIDPITAYAGVAKMDWNSAGDVRGFLRPLTELAERRKVAVVIVQHMRKDTSAHNAQMAVAGSVGLVAAARAVWTVTKDKDDEDRMLFLAAKSNLAKVSARGLAYRVESATVKGKDGDGISTSRVVWEKALVDKTADEALRDANEDGGSRRTKEQAVQWLRELLEEKPMLADAVKKAAVAAGYSEATVRRAKDSLGIVPKKKGFSGAWEWRLPE